AYQMLSGRLPFDGDTPSRKLFQHAFEAPRPLREAAPGIPAGLAALVMRLLAREPGDRYPSCAEALADLRRWREQASASRSGNEVIRPGPGRGPVADAPTQDRSERLPAASPWSRRRLVLLGVVAPLLAGALTAWLWLRRTADGPGESGGDSPPVT